MTACGGVHSPDARKRNIRQPAFSSLRCGGTSGVGGSAAGGADGGGGAGPVVVPIGTNCSGATVTGQIVTARAPAVLTARLSNSVLFDNSNVSIVPTSAKDTAYVSFYHSEHLAKIAPSGVSDEATGVCGVSAAMVVDGTDAPGNPFGLAARGSCLFLAIPDHDVVDVFIVDVTKL